MTTLLNFTKASEIAEFIQDVATNTTLKSILHSVEAQKVWSFINDIEPSAHSPSISEDFNSIDDLISTISARATMQETTKHMFPATQLLTMLTEKENVFNVPELQAIDEFSSRVRNIAAEATLKAMLHAVAIQKEWAFIYDIEPSAHSPSISENFYSIDDLVSKVSAQATMQEATKHMLPATQLLTMLTEKENVFNVPKLQTIDEISSCAQNIVTEATLKAILHDVAIQQEWAFINDNRLLTLTAVENKHILNIQQIIAKSTDRLTAKGIRKALHEAKFERYVAKIQEKSKGRLETMHKDPKFATILPEARNAASQPKVLKINPNLTAPPNNINMETPHDHDTRDEYGKHAPK